ncbi:MAG: phosphate signaling complex protein PhoU [Armatimonadota bacterium]|nr:phosphate signaling complex protein PhoU [Armatimonadota bacterium]
MPEIRQAFHEQLKLLEEQILRMGELTRAMVADAVLALEQSDLSVVESVVAQDDVVDALDLEIESLCVRLLVLQQPAGRDLRLISAAIKVITDIERIGDHAVDIAEISRKLAQELYLRIPLVNVAPLAERAQQMLRLSLQALVERDTVLAAQVCAENKWVDEELRSLRHELFNIGHRDAALSAAASYTLLAAVYIERIADHATNIAERVHYIETGILKPLGRTPSPPVAEAPPKA